MDLDPLLLSRIQFAFTISFHIIFPSFTIGLAAWLATMEGVHLTTGNPLYRRVFDFWLKVFAVSFGMGVVSGIVMAFQFGTNWSVLAEKAGSIQGPLLGYETFTAFVLEATFLGVVLFGRDRVPRWFYFAACCMLALGTMASSFWILANNSWMQVPVGHTIVDGKIIPSDWKAVIGGPVFLIRWMHMLLAAFLVTAMCVIAAGASYLLRGMVAAFVQGAAIGRMVQELPVVDGRYAGGAFEWVTPFSMLCGAGLVLGYAMLGAAWLALKTEGDLRDWAYRRLDWLLAAVVVVLIAVFAFALATQMRVLDRWLNDPRFVALQLIGVIAIVGLLIGVRRWRDGVPFAMAILLVAAAFLRLGVSFWPYMIPYSITVQQAAAPVQSLEFLFWGAGIVVFPVVLIYTSIVYWIFRGKVGKVARDY
jgi:hypothetical protein